LNNTLKHASARKVRVSMELGADQFVLIISDDGCGVDPVQLKPVPGGFGGNGLKNMTVRREQIGGRCELESRIGKGTIVRFFVKIDIPQGHTTG